MVTSQAFWSLTGGNMIAFIRVHLGHVSGLKSRAEAVGIKIPV